MLTVCIVGPILTVTDNYFVNRETWTYLWMNSTAYSTVYFLPGVFETLHDRAMNGSLWSIVIEVKLYLIIFFLGFLSILKNKYVFNFLFFLLLIIGYFQPAFFDFFVKYEHHKHVALMFLMGSFIYVNKDDFYLNPLILLLLFFFAATQHGTNNFGVAYNVLLPYLVFYMGFSFEIKLFNKLGDYSYGVYLYGWLVQQLVIYSYPSISNFYHAIISIFFALLLGVISWHIIEKKAMACKKRFI